MKDVLNANYKCSTDPNAAWIPTDLPACEIKGTLNPNTEDIEVKYISPEKFKQYIDENNHITLVDVREKYELEGPLGHIDGVVHIPIGKLTDSLKQLAAYEDSNLILICRSGSRASSAAKILTTADFTNVYVFEGGMVGYRMKGY
jgi:rhodanese-related sulfurtransferase